MDSQKLTTENAAIHQDSSRLRSNDNITANLNIKTSCQFSKKPMSKLKLRKGKIKEFIHCIQCWRKSHLTQQPSPSSSNTTGALFDVLGGINNLFRNQTRDIAYLDSHIFDGPFRWMIKESQKQPSIKLRISTDQSNYHTFKKPCPKINPSNFQTIADMGAQSSSLMCLKEFLRCGFSISALFLVKKKMFASNNEGINIMLSHQTSKREAFCQHP